MTKQRIDLNDIKEWGIIVVVPYSFINKYRDKWCLTPQDAALSIIADYTEIKMENYGPFKFGFMDDFGTNCMLVRITANEPISGLYAMVPGNEYVRLNLWRI